MSPDPPTPTPGNNQSWRLDRAERDISTIQSEVIRMRESLERALSGSMAEMKTDIALLKAGLTNIQQILAELRADQQAIRKDFQTMDDKREEGSKVFSRWMIAFVTAALTVAVTSIFALARSA